MALNYKKRERKDYNPDKLEFSDKETFLLNLRNLINISKIPDTKKTGLLVFKMSVKGILPELIRTDIRNNMNYDQYLTAIASYDDKFAGVKGQAEEKEFKEFAKKLDENLQDIVKLYSTERHPIKYNLSYRIVESDEKAEEALAELEKKIESDS